MQHSYRLSGFFDVAFDLHISSIACFVVDRVAKIVLFVSVNDRLKQMIHQYQPKEAQCFPLPSLYLLCWATVFLILV